MGSVPLLAVVMFFAGLAISPTLIAGFSLVEAEVPASRLTEGLAWISTALNIGVSIGAAVAGPVIDGAGESPGFVVAEITDEPFFDDAKLVNYRFEDVQVEAGKLNAGEGAVG